MRKHLIFLAMFFFIITSQAMAQQPPRDYAITVTSRFSDDEADLILEVTVVNNGGPSQTETEVNVAALNEGGKVISTQALNPLQSGESAVVTFIIPVSTFAPGSVQQFQVEVGIDQFEIAGTALAQNNFRTISTQIPTRASQPGAANGETSTAAEASPAEWIIPVLNVPLNLNDPVQIVLLTITAVVLILMLWIISVILRLIFKRPQRFGSWQPPYTNLSYHPPDSLNGRRQAWQQHAQNGTILAACAEGSLHAVKRLLSMDGMPFSGWSATALRMSQYDMYGRVARTEVIMPRGIVKRLNRVMRKSAGLPPDRLRRQAAPIAKGMMRLFGKKISRRGAMLPIALDIRFQGKHGEVRIHFELYQCQHNFWVQLDSWEPEMTVVGRTIQESYTYTIHGQVGSETLREFRKRLQEDLVWLLTEMLIVRQSAPSTPAPDLVAPDTLTDIQPVRST